MWIVFTNIYDVFGILFCLEVYWTKTFSKQKMSRFFVSLQAVPGWNEVKFQAPGDNRDTRCDDMEPTTHRLPKQNIGMNASGCP